jgi:hypothetical protein
MTSRALSILQTSVFDAWAAYDPVAIGTQSDDVQRPSEENTLANKNEAISYAAYRTLVDLFPSQVTLFNSVMSSLGYDTTNQSSDMTKAAGIGNWAAQAVLDYQHNDGSNQLGTLNASGKAYSEPTLDPNYVAYKPVNTVDQLNSINHWQPLRQIANYWADGAGTVTPPGHWNVIAQEISQRDNHTLDDDVKMFFALDNALSDASIAAWDAKRAYDGVRPITAINYLFKNDPDFQAKYPNGWNSYIGTPPFAEYVSGHSTFSAAAAETLKLFTGSDYYGGSYTDSATGITLEWDTFSNAAAEGGMSRLYGGIHFMDGNLVGQDLGRKVAGWVWDKVGSYILPGRSKGDSSGNSGSACGWH